MNTRVHTCVSTARVSARCRAPPAVGGTRWGGAKWAEPIRAWPKKGRRSLTGRGPNQGGAKLGVAKVGGASSPSPAPWHRSIRWAPSTRRDPAPVRLPGAAVLPTPPARNGAREGRDHPPRLGRGTGLGPGPSHPLGAGVVGCACAGAFFFFFFWIAVECSMQMRWLLPQCSSS